MIVALDKREKPMKGFFIEIKSNKSGKYEIIAPMGEGYTASLVEVVFYPNSKTPITLTTGTHVLPNKYSFSSYKSKLK